MIDDFLDCKEYIGYIVIIIVVCFVFNGFKVVSGDFIGMLCVWEFEIIESIRGEYGIILGCLMDIVWDGDL